MLSMSMKKPQQRKNERRKEQKRKERRGKKIEMLGGRDDRNKEKGPTHPHNTSQQSFFRKSLPTTEGTPILWSPKVHYCIHRTQNSSPTLTQINTANMHPYHF